MMPVTRLNFQRFGLNWVVLRGYYGAAKAAVELGQAKRASGYYGQPADCCAGQR
jgi:hypothetical protein